MQEARKNKNNNNNNNNNNKRGQNETRRQKHNTTNENKKWSSIEKQGLQAGKPTKGKKTETTKEQVKMARNKRMKNN